MRLLLECIQPALHDVSKGRWANIRSLVFKSLDHAGVRRMPGRCTVVPTSAWQLLLDPLPYRPAKVALLPFARFCSQRCVEPDQVDQAIFDLFAGELEEFSGRSRPREAYLDACRAWESARATYPHWPPLSVARKDRRDWYALPWSRFPASLRMDIEAMAKAAVSPDPLCPTSRKPIKPVSAASRVSLLRAFAGGLVDRGRDPATLKSIADLVEVDAAKSGLEFMYDRAGQKKSPHVHQMAKLLCTLARHHVYQHARDQDVDLWRAAERHIGKLEAFRRSLDPGRHGMTSKNRATLRFFEDDRLVAKFLALPDRLFRRYQSRRSLKISDAVRLQVALAVEVLTVAPIRCKNLVEIRLDQNIIDQGSGRNRRVHLHFAAEAVKNASELEFEMPRSTVRLLDYYLAHVRPRLQRVPSQHLFPGEVGSHKSGMLLSQQIASLVEDEVGVRLTAHQFRHLAGFLFLRENPGGHEVVRRLLGHKSIDTTIRFYAGMEAAEAVRHYDDHISKRRAELMVPSRRRRNSERLGHASRAT